MFEKLIELSLLHPAPSFRLCAMSGLPSDHESYARAALAAYGRDRDSPLRLLSLSENATYLVDDGDPMVLRVHRPGYHSLEAIRSELRWMAALREQTPVVTPELIPARDGSDVVSATVAGNTAARRRSHVHHRLHRRGAARRRRFRRAGPDHRGDA